MAVVGGIQVATGQITLGSIQAFIQYVRQFNQPLTQVAGMYNTLQSGIASAERVFDLLDADEEAPDKPATLPSPDGQRGRVEFDDVNFAYRPGTPVIEDLSLVAEPGSTVAIVGPTGAGKTTLVNLLMRFYDVDSGRILVDGVDITTVSRESLRSRIGMVLQDTWLFDGTIYDNIAYGRPDADEDEVVEAARAAYVDRFVHTLPDGYETWVSDDGGNISAGREAADHDRPRVPGPPAAADPRRGDQFGGHPHRAADPARDGRTSPRPDEFHHRPPAFDHPRRRPDPGDGGRAGSSSGAATPNCWPGGASTGQWRRRRPQRSLTMPTVRSRTRNAATTYENTQSRPH